MANILFTVIYILAGFWILSKLLAWLIQRALKQHLGVSLKIGKLGLLGFSKLQLSTGSGLTIEIDHVWLSSSFMNPDIRKPLVLCVQDIRIQTKGQEESHPNQSSSGPRGENFTGSTGNTQEGYRVGGGGTDRLRNVLVKILFFGQFFGLRVQNLTVVLLKSMIPDSLVHVTAGEILLDITIYNENYIVKTNLNSVLFKALRSMPGEAHAQNCLAELSVTLQMEARSDTRDPLQLTTLMWDVIKPQMMLTEGFLQNLPKSRSSPNSMQRNPQEIEDEDLFRTAAEPAVSEKLAMLWKLRALSFEVLDLDVKIVRETKQRSLAVSLKHFQVCLKSTLTAHRLLDFSFTLVLEEFLTKSPQAQFAELSKIKIKTERFCSLNSVLEENVACLQNLMQSFGVSSVRDTVEVTVKIFNGFFHYHHEEVQYWSAVFWRVSQREATASVVRQRSPKKSFISRSPLLTWLRERKTTVILDMTQLSSAISSATCAGLHMQLSQARISTSVKAALGVEDTSSLATAFDVSLEIEVQTVWCCHMEAKIPEEEVISPVHHWDHVFYLALVIVKVQKLGHEVRMEALENNLSVEWSTKTYEVLSQLFIAINRPRSSANTSQLSDTVPPAVPAMSGDRTQVTGLLGVESQGTSEQVSMTGELSSAEQLVLNVVGPAWHISLKLDVSNINLFVCDSAGVCVLLHINSIAVQHTPLQSSLSLEVFRILYLKYTGKLLSMHRVQEVSSSVLHIHEVKATFTEGKRELRIHILQELTFRWTMSAHMCVLQGVQNATALLDKAVPSQRDKIAANPVKRHHVGERHMNFMINVLIHADIHLSAQLSKNHRLCLHTHSLLVTATLPEMVMEVRNFTVKCDGNNILSVQGFQLETLSVSHLQHEREGFKNLTQSVNRGWGLSCESFDAIFPYKYNFAACYEEIMNTVKWLKLVHKIKKKPFTVDSPLPPDIKVKAKMWSIEVCDDPFEVKIGLNYELLKDEVMESKKRTEVLDNKLEQLLRTKNISVAKREELYASLYKKSSEIYIQRSRQLYSNAPRKQLLTWLMEDLEIVALADPSYHGRENVIKVMKEIDTDSPGPKEDTNFVTLWCRSIKFSVKHWSVSLRDFPQPMIDITNMHVWGRLIGAEREGTKRAKRTCAVELDAPWGNMDVERNLPPLKFFHDFSSDITSVTLAYGVCWEPAVALFNLSMDLINRPSVDPSRPLPFWDKMRLLLHGRLTMAIERNSWLYHASLDPYNNTELMDWTWSHLVLDWTNGQFVLKGDLDISLRTASKYNESRLFHLPDLRFCVGLKWLCLGDSNDHHSVMPCAPDKVPDFSLEEHDSFRAFRSQHLNLDLSLKIKPVPGNASNMPSAPEFYASSLRFLEKIKQCMFSVTRPVRRGKLFGVTTLRKPQLTRHYRKIRLSIDFHRFVICHWMSNAKKHGAELVADSFNLRMCNRLTLVPVEDGLLHRPRAEWSIKYLNCCLGTTQIFLCQESRPNESSSSSGVPVDRSFFLSVSKISYQRADSRKPKPGKEVDPEQDHKTPRHSIAIHEMRGAWNEANRAVVLGLYDSYMKAQALRRNLSSEVLKGFKVDNAQSNAMRNRSFSLNSPENDSSSDPTSPSPLSKLQTGHAHSMLLKLVSESDSKSVAFTDETSNANMELLHGVKACRPINILSTNWLIELHNSQVIVKGCETPGFLIVSAARAKIISYIHMPIWRSSQLRSKSTWTGTVDCMQYYATVDPDYVLNDDTIPWLSRENVEDRSTTGLTGLPEMVSSGQSVGSVVSSTVPAAASAYPEQKSSTGEQTVQLQRIIHRCSCKFYYANYGDVDPNSFSDVPLLPTEDSDVMTEEEGVDTFTLLHESVQAYSNSVQYSIIMDIVNNLLLYVEPKKKEASEKLQSMRFKLQLSREDQKTPILQLQEVVRERVQHLRKLERDFYVAKMNNDEEHMEDLEVQMEDVKNWINTKNEELSMRISCFNESQLQMKAQMKVEKAQQAQVLRRNEVCFKYAKWRLTERDGHCGIAETELRNFVYTKVNRDDNTWTHQLELGWLKMENLLRDSFYQKVLMPRDPLDQDGENRQMLLRIFCSERPPVGGISVKEHFEVNVAPIQIQMTYQLYKAVMQYFFPDKNIEADDDEELEGAKKRGDKKSAKKEKDKEPQLSLKKSHSFSSADDINKMRERAAKNNTFLYIKIPEVHARVSYKGEKEKNIEDVHDFNFVFPTIEYHNCIWTWFDFFIVLKNVAKRVVLSQAIKQKLHMRPRLTDEMPVTDVQEEQDKVKMLLGAKLLYGQDKPSKKGFFTKSHKP